MELAFEALREASVRIPKSIGQSVSIIGALIIGTAAVQAGIVSAAMVIIVSLTGIASFIIPHFDLGLTVRLLRFPIMFMAAMFGLYGIACGLILIYIHLVNLKSFGLPYLSPLTPYVSQDMKDTFVRAPWWSMLQRPKFMTHNDTRQKNNSRRWSQQTGENE
ncbi:Spore germination protein XA [compost metagenome]